MVLEVATRQGPTPTPGVRAPHPPGPLVRRLMLYFGRKKANFWKKIWAKVSIQSELRISIYIRNGERAESESAETEGNRERSNLGGALAPPTPWRPWTRGETLLPSREKVKEEEEEEAEEGGLSPPRFRWRRNAAGAIIITAIFTNTYTIFTNISITFPPLSTAVHSRATRCTLYLNMVLYASYYYPTMCCHPMMSE